VSEKQRAHARRSFMQFSVRFVDILLSKSTPYT
jgi:hypothetical protein